MVRRARLAAILLASLLVPGLAFAQVAPTYPTVAGGAPSSAVRELGQSGTSDAGAVQMYDDGTHGDAVAGDGIWTTQVTLAPPAAPPAPGATEYKIEPPNHVLNDGQAIGQAPQSGNALGIPLNFPAAQSYTVEFRYADNGSTGWHAGRLRRRLLEHRLVHLDAVPAHRQELGVRRGLPVPVRRPPPRASTRASPPPPATTTGPGAT